MSFQAQTDTKLDSGYESNAGVGPGALDRWEVPPWAGPFHRGPGSPSPSAYVFAGNPHTASSRIRPANDRETSRNDENGRSIEFAGQEPDSRIVPGSEIGPGNTLKVETRVRTPLGLPPPTCRNPDYGWFGQRWMPRVPLVCSPRPAGAGGNEHDDHSHDDPLRRPHDVFAHHVLIDSEENRTLRAVLVGMLRGLQPGQANVPPRQDPLALAAGRRWRYARSRKE